jgi:sigma-B regulation protein RsbU (phosphoserine phosphatase)
VRWDEIRDSSGLEGYCYAFSRSEYEEPHIVNLSPWTTSIVLASGEEGLHYFHIRAKDLVGNTTKTLTVPFTVDLTPPDMPELIELPLSEDGFYEHNSPVFQWVAEGADVAGFNFSLSSEPVTLVERHIRTMQPLARYASLEEGAWCFNVVAVDRAGNISETAHFAFRLKPMPGGDGYAESYAPDAEAGAGIPGRVVSRGPLNRLTLYFVIGGNLIIVLFILSQLLFRREVRSGTLSDGRTSGQDARKRIFGLRTKFSLLVVALVLVLTVGISSTVNSMNTRNLRTALADQMMDKALQQLENMKNIAREGILNDDTLLLLSLISRTMENGDLTFSAILDPAGKVIAHSDLSIIGGEMGDSKGPLAGDARATHVEPAYDPNTLKETYQLSAPVRFEGELVGSVRLGYSTRAIFETIEEQRKNNLFGTLIITAVTVLIGIAGAVLMATFTIRPLQALTRGARIIGEGKLDYRIHIASRDEIGILSDEINLMSERLLEYQKQVEKQAKLDEQLEIARAIQQDLIPRNGINGDRVSLDGFYRAARGVGGDYYDFHRLSDDRLGIIMSDVSGKGIPAALMMVMIRTIFMSLIHSGTTGPARVVSLLNETLSATMAADRFATLLFGVFDERNMEFRYTNAGYGPLLVYRHGLNTCTLIEPANGSLPVGIMAETEFSDEEPVTFDRDDALFLFTDGITEARNERNEEYGIQRLQKIIPDLSANPPREITRLIIDEITRFTGNAEQFDDMSFAVLQAKGGAPHA